ncbi:MAG: hypothetical protein ACFE85_08365 [Candidatus Hodarchaeota archaeon]
MKSKNLFSGIKESLNRFYRKVFFKELFVEGKEPPKSYGFDKKFIGIYLIFLFYSFVLLISLNFRDFFFLQIITLFNPFAFCNALVTFFLLMSFLYSSDKIRIFIFEKNTALKQVLIYILIILGFYYLFSFVFTTAINFMSYLLMLSTIWLVLYSTRFFMYSRKFATKLEARFISKYSPFRRFLAMISPYFILGILVVISLIYRSLLVFLSLDFFGSNAPGEAVRVYNIEMRLIMPLIYFSLVLTLLFILFEFVFTRRKAETKRAGLFDNYTFSLIVLFIFFFQIFQISIFLILRPETVDALKATVGATSSTVSVVFIIEFLISMFFLYRIIRKLGRSLGWQILLFKRDGLILLILGCVFAQTLTRYALQTEVSNQEITLIGNILLSDKFIVSIIMIVFLGATLLIYYLKPHETSMFIRLQKETVSNEEENLIIIYKLLKNEYIRRAAAYPIEILEREMIKATKLSKGAVYSLIKELVESDMDIVLFEQKNDFGVKQKFIDFVSVTEKFDSKYVAQKKAKRFLSDRLYKTMTANERKSLKLASDFKSEKATDLFLSSLSNDYTKKQKDLKLFEKKQKETEIAFINKEIPEALRESITHILKKEYIYRLENEDKYPDFNYSISEIASQVQIETKITPGELYPILESLRTTDLELELLENPEEPEDKKISFFPYADEDLLYCIASFRPEEYNRIKKEINKIFLKHLNKKRKKASISKLRKAIGNNTEEQKKWNAILRILYDYFPIYVETLERVEKGEEISKVYEIFPKKDIDIFLI